MNSKLMTVWYRYSLSRLECTKTICVKVLVAVLLLCLWPVDEVTAERMKFDSVTYTNERLSTSECVSGNVKEHLALGCGRLFWPLLFEEKKVEKVYFSLEEISQAISREQSPGTDYLEFYEVNVLLRAVDGCFWARWTCLPGDTGLDELVQVGCGKIMFEELTERQISDFLHYSEQTYDIYNMTCHRRPGVFVTSQSTFAFVTVCGDSLINSFYINDPTIPHFESFYELKFWYDRLQLCDECIFFLLSDTARGSHDRWDMIQLYCGLDSAGIDSILQFWPSDRRPSWDRIKAMRQSQPESFDNGKPDRSGHDR